MILRMCILSAFFFPLMGKSQRMMQPNVKVVSMLEDQPFIPGNTYVLRGDTLTCSELKLYLGGFSVRKEGAVVAQWPLDYFLIDFSDASTTSFQLPEFPSTDFDEVTFIIGVDSLLQVDGPHGGALDPALGMYWTWQNGYIYAKVEGTSSRSAAPKHEFAWHLGGYNGSLNAARRCSFSCARKHMTITMDWSGLTDSFNKVDQHHVMSPSLTAVRAMKLLQEGITVK
jgi:hypothetical protein